MRTVSSANNFVLKLDTRGMALIYIKNSNGPRIEPCGTPQVTRLNFDLVQAKFGDLPYQMLFFRSRNTAQVYFFWSIFSERLSNNCLTASDVEEFCLKPNGTGVNILFLFK